MTVTALIMSPGLVAVTDPIANWTEVTAELRYCAAGVCEVTAPASSGYVTAANTPGNYLVIVRDGVVFGGGKIEGQPAMSWNPNEGIAVAKVTSATFEGLLGERITYPNPAAAANVQGSATYSATAVNGETYMRNLVNLNAGPGALTARRITGLALGAVAGGAGLVTATTRFEPLLDALRTAAVTAGVGFRVRMVGTQLLFEVYVPVDRTGSVRFSRDRGNLREYISEPQAPTATVAIVGGNGEGATREVVERTNSSAITAGWGRVEVFVNASGSDVTTAELQQQGDAVLVEAAEKAGLSVVAVDGPQSQFGVDYNLGDLISIEPLPGVAVAEVVTGVKLTATVDGELVSPAIGVGPYSEPATVALLRQIDRRLGRLERM